MIQVVLNDNDFAVINGFCQAIQQKQNKYGSRDFHNNDTGIRRFGNNFIGKIGEYAATKIVGGEIDLNVWNTGSRGIEQFEADIINTEEHPIVPKFVNNKLHVKTCNDKHIINMRPGFKASWTADRNDPLVTKPQKDDIVIFMFAGSSGKTYALGWAYATQIQRLWKNCVSEHMKHKVAVYFTDVRPFIQRF
jgi:hypothetical protein